MRKSRHESGKVAVGVIVIVVLVVLIAGRLWTTRPARGRLCATPAPGQGRLADTATTTKVKTACCCRKPRVGLDTTVATDRGEVTLTGQVPSEGGQGTRGGHRARHHRRQRGAQQLDRQSRRRANGRASIGTRGGSRESRPSSPYLAQATSCRPRITVR